MEPVTEGTVVPSDADPGHDPHPWHMEFIAGDPFTFRHQSTSEPAVLPALARRLVDRDDTTKDLQFPDRRFLHSNPQARVRDKNFTIGILDAQEHLEAAGCVVVVAQQGQRLKARRERPAGDLAAPNAGGDGAPRTETTPRGETSSPPVRGPL